MKIYLYNDNSNILTPQHRPFIFNCTITKNVEECDRILVKSGDYVRFISDKTFTHYTNKGVVYANDDNPNFLLQDNKVKKLIAQPLHDKKTLEKYNVTTIPLIMTDHLNIHLDGEFLNKCRNQEKIYDYYFVGQFYGKRDVLKGFNSGNSVIKQTSSIYHLTEEEKIKTIKEFLLELSKSKFGFAPRGMGSNSFRLYECLMVGTIPISTDVIEYPFDDEVNWDDFTIRGSLDNLNGLISKSSSIEYGDYRQKGIDFWEEYIKMDRCYEILKNE